MNITSYRRKYENYERLPEQPDHTFSSVWGYFYDPVELQLESVYYADIKEDKQGDFIELPYGTYSDYSGGTVERANCDVFLEQFKEYLGSDIFEIYGGYGTRGVLIRKSLYDTNEEVKEVIDNLDNYPCIDDEQLSELEFNIESESWDDWVKSDLIRLLDKNNIPYEEDTLQEKFYQVMDHANIYFEHEDANSVWVDLDRIIEHWNDEQ